jgi:guanylate kinase
MTDIKRRGMLLVFSSPSGAGKTTLTRRLLEEEAELDLSVSATTRDPRPGEEEGVHYFFKDKPAFQDMIEQDELLEHAAVFGNYYGTPRAPVLEALDQGRDVLFDIDWQGARQIRAAQPVETVSIFILPPSVPALEDRLRKRGQDSDEVIMKRMQKSGGEMQHWDEYDYVVVNNDLEASYRSIQAILHAERVKRDRQVGMKHFANELIAEATG